MYYYSLTTFIKKKRTFFIIRVFIIENTALTTFNYIYLYFIKKKLSIYENLIKEDMAKLLGV